MTTLRLILADQLNASHSWFKTRDDDVMYLLCELKQETDYVRHHVQKVCAFFAAMAEFAQALRQAGHQVLHLDLDDSTAASDLPQLLQQLIQQHHIKHFGYQRPDEYRLLVQLQQFCQQLQQQGISSHQADSEHFLLDFDAIAQHFPPGKSLLMERFYRQMRHNTGLLMENGKPSGGQWNYDKDNRQKLSKTALEQVPQPWCCRH